MRMRFASVSAVSTAGSAYWVRDCRSLRYQRPHRKRGCIFPIRKDGAGKTAVIVGGGPAGMEAARVLALRQFHVVLFEEGGETGRTLNVADQACF